MEEHDDAGFIPDAHGRAEDKSKAGTVSRARSRWRGPAVATAIALVAALCLHTGSAAHGTTAAAKPAAIIAHEATGTANSGTDKTPLASKNIQLADDSSGGPGLHGAFNLYKGAGGGLEFWFDPNSGNLTLAIGIGLGTGTLASLGTYTRGTAPAPGTYMFVTTDFGAGSVASFNALGTYSFTDGKFVGSISGTVEGRTLTLDTDGNSIFDVSVFPAAGAEGYFGAIGVSHVFNFNVQDVVNYIWNVIKSAQGALYTIEVGEGSNVDTVYAGDPDDPATGDGTVVASSGSLGDSTGSSASDGGSSGGDGCGSTSDDDIDGGDHDLA